MPIMSTTVETRVVAPAHTESFDPGLGPSERSEVSHRRELTIVARIRAFSKPVAQISGLHRIRGIEGTVAWMRGQRPSHRLACG